MGCGSAGSGPLWTSVHWSSRCPFWSRRRRSLWRGIGRRNPPLLSRLDGCLRQLTLVQDDPLCQCLPTTSRGLSQQMRGAQTILDRHCYRTSAATQRSIPSPGRTQKRQAHGYVDASHSHRELGHVRRLNHSGEASNIRDLSVADAGSDLVQPPVAFNDPGTLSRPFPSPESGPPSSPQCTPEVCKPVL